MSANVDDDSEEELEEQEDDGHDDDDDVSADGCGRSSSRGRGATASTVA